MGVPQRGAAFNIYSGHDTTVFPILQALGIATQSGYGWVPYAAVLAVENYGNAQLRFIYSGKVMRLPACNNAELCDWPVLQSYLKTLFPSSSLPYDCLKRYFKSKHGANVVEASIDALD